MKTLITGATGTVGSRLFSKLGSAAVLSRAPKEATEAKLPGARAFVWQPEQALPPAEAFEGVECVFHLAGEPVASSRWSEKKKAAIRDSRVIATRNLVDVLSGLKKRPKALISASAVGFYGDGGEALLDEASPPGGDFLAKLCAAWEAEARAAETLGMRVVCARLGMVLSPTGGALERMLPIFRRGLGGRLGSGQQWMSWVHIDDVVGLLLHAASSALSGPLNVVSPQPIRNLDFTRALAEAVGRQAVLPAPKLGLRLALGELSGMLTASQRVLPRAAEGSGYEFACPELEAALAGCVRRD